MGLPAIQVRGWSSIHTEYLISAKPVRWPPVCCTKPNSPAVPIHPAATKASRKTPVSPHPRPSSAGDVPSASGTGASPQSRASGPKNHSPGTPTSATRPHAPSAAAPRTSYPTAASAIHRLPAAMARAPGRSGSGLAPAGRIEQSCPLARQVTHGNPPAQSRPPPQHRPRSSPPGCPTSCPRSACAPVSPVRSPLQGTAAAHSSAAEM
jgi:hypothetical protein